MDFSFWVIISLVIILIVILILYLWIYSRNSQNNGDNTYYEAPVVWSTPIPGPNAPQNTCLAYTFPAINVNGVVTPATPSFNSDIIEQLTGVTPLPSCADVDQLSAQQLQHTCQNPQGITVPNPITLCYTQEGQLVDTGYVETFYGNGPNTCPRLPQCSGQLSILALNYQGPNTSSVCLVNNQANNAGTAPCTIAEEDQLFRITMINPGQNPGQLTPGESNNGLLAQILDRQTGLCLNVNQNVTSSTTYNGCSSPITLTGNPVNLQECSVESGGYLWSFLPSLTYNLTGTDITSPPQLLYLGNLDLSTFPINGSFQQYSGDSAIAAWLTSQQNTPLSLYYGDEGTPILFNWGTDSSQCGSQGYITQYVNYNSYNLLI